MPGLLQLYAGASQVFGDFGDSAEPRIGFNCFLQRMRGIRLNGEWIDLDFRIRFCVKYNLSHAFGGN